MATTVSWEICPFGLLLVALFSVSWWLLDDDLEPHPQDHMTTMPEDAPTVFQLVNLAGDSLGICSLPLSCFGSFAKEVIAEQLLLQTDFFKIVGVKDTIDDVDMLCEVTEPDKRLITVVSIAPDTS